MTNKNKLKILVAVFFVFIIILASMLVYVIKSNRNELTGNLAAVTTDSTSGQTQAAVSTDTTAPSTESSTTENVQENIDLKLYFYDADSYDEPKEIRTVKVDKKLYSEDISSAINTLLSSTSLKINKATVNGKSIIIDLPKETALKFNSGSAGGITYTNILAMTVLNLPGIEQMEVTVDGIAGVESDHFSFNGTFEKSKDAKKYTFKASDKESKGLYE